MLRGYYWRVCNARYWLGLAAEVQCERLPGSGRDGEGRAVAVGGFSHQDYASGVGHLYALAAVTR